MKTIAKALIGAAAFLELSGEDFVDLDASVKALEEIGHGLQSASPEELAAIRLALQEMIAEERAGLARPDMLNFYAGFLESFGMTG